MSNRDPGSRQRAKSGGKLKKDVNRVERRAGKHLERDGGAEDRAADEAERDEEEAAAEWERGHPHYGMDDHHDDRWDD